MVRFEPTSLLLAPSTIHMLLLRPLPLTASEMPDIRPRSFVLKSLPALTPGISVVSCRKLRPFSGSSRTCSPVTSPDTSPPTVCTASGAASTVTVSDIAPVSSVTSTVRTSATFKATPWRTADLNPVSATSTP